MSLDGCVAGPDVSREAPMGSSGEVLHEWMFKGRSAAEFEDLETNHFGSIGAVIIGRRMADLGIGPWGEEPPFHAPVFVVTNRPVETIVKQGGTSYIFVTGGIDDALRRACEVAGTQDVMVNGGADIARQYLQAGAVQELRLHLVPVSLGAGTRLFDETPLKVRPLPVKAASTPQATHLTYEVSVPAEEDRARVRVPMNDPLWGAMTS
jgi:dihydrofolate reductase